MKKAEAFEHQGRQIIRITFPYKTEDVEFVKTLRGRRFHPLPPRKFWTCDLSTENVMHLKEKGFDVDHQLLALLEKNTIKTPVEELPDIEFPALKNTLFPFQRQGVAFVESRNGRALIGDDPGLGKTMQALGWLSLHPEKRRVLIICPASLKLNWKREIQAWLHNPKVKILSGYSSYSSSSDALLHDGIVIVNYDLLSDRKTKNKLAKGWMERLISFRPDILVCDEVHMIKNNNAKRTKAVKKLAAQVPHVIGLSGTPIVSRPIELYNAVMMIDDSILPDRWAFAHRFCGAKHDRYGWDFSGATNTAELHEILTSTIMIRRSKSEVLHDLPDKLRNAVAMSIDNRDEYSLAAKNFIAWLKKTKGNSAATRFSRIKIEKQARIKLNGLKKLAVKGKLQNAIQWIQTFLKSDEKLVVFAHHRFVIDCLMDEFSNVAVKVDGTVTGADRQKAVDDFQTRRSVRLFIGSIQASGMGLTLTAASNVAFVELPWTPGDLIQAEDRCHRIGQKFAVNIYYLVASRTVEEIVVKVIDRKRRVLDSVLDGEKTGESDLLTELISEAEKGKI